MTRSATWWPDHLLAAPKVLFVLSVLALTPAAFFATHRSDHPPPYAFPHYAADPVDLTMVPSTIERVLVLINRHYRLNETPPYLALLIWLPLAVGIFGMRLFYQTHPSVDERWSRFLIAAGGAALLVSLFWTWEWLSLILVSVSVLLSFVALFCIHQTRSGETPQARERLDWGVRLHLLAVTWLLLSAAVLSSSTHVVLVNYAGYAPSTDKFAEVATKLDQLIDVETPFYIRDDAAWRMAQVASINRLGWRMSIFGLNRCAAVGFACSIILYMFLWPTVILHHHKHTRTRTLAKSRTLTSMIHLWRRLYSTHRGYDSARFVRIIFAAVAYIAAGFAFAVIFYNDYTNEAAKQNVMAAYADYLIADADRAKQIEDYFRKRGWSASVESEILRQARLHQDDSERLAPFIRKTRARYWPATVIAHETPQVRSWEPHNPGTDSPELETEFAIDPVMSFHDMIYFSFISFTTTGYGDVRPVSDRLRFWTIIENVVEILFVAMFIGVAVDA